MAKRNGSPLGSPSVTPLWMSSCPSKRAYQTDLYVNMHHTVQGHLYKTMGCARDFSGIISNFHLIGWFWKLTHAQTRVHYQSASPNLSAKTCEIRGTKTNASGKWGRYSHTSRGQVWEDQGPPAEEAAVTLGKHPLPSGYPRQPDSWTGGEELNISTFYNNGNQFSLEVKTHMCGLPVCRSESLIFRSLRLFY